MFSFYDLERFASKQRKIIMIEYETLSVINTIYTGAVMKKIVYYTVFLKKTDDVIIAGTAKDCAKAMGKSLNGFHSMVSKNSKKKQNKYFIVKEFVNIDKKGLIYEIEEDK